MIRIVLNLLYIFLKKTHYRLKLKILKNINLKMLKASFRKHDSYMTETCNKHIEKLQYLFLKSRILYNVESWATALVTILMNLQWLLVIFYRIEKSLSSAVFWYLLRSTYLLIKKYYILLYDSKIFWVRLLSKTLIPSVEKITTRTISYHD